MARKVEWTDVDDIAVEELSKLMAHKKLSYRSLSEKMGMSISFSRLRNVMTGHRGPLSLSEFVYVCQALDVDPASELEKILDRAGMPTMTLAAMHDPQKRYHTLGGAAAQDDDDNI